MVKEGLGAVKEDLGSIFDVVAAASLGGTNILVEGSVFGLNHYSICYHKIHDILAKETLTK